MLLFPDPRPLVERLGLAFFGRAPECPGVYLMRDATDTVLYVGKAKNLKRRLGHYRVANPERMPRRHLRLLRAVERIQLEECPDESSALAREAELLRLLRPRFNRAGTWPGIPRFFAWRATGEALELAVAQSFDSCWRSCGPLGYVAFTLRIILVRLLWCALYPERGLPGMPSGWFAGHYGEVITIAHHQNGLTDFRDAAAALEALFAGDTNDFTEWVRERADRQSHPFELSVRESDLEELRDLTEALRAKYPPIAAVDASSL